MQESCKGPKSIEDCLNCTLSECKSNKPGLFDFEKKAKYHIPKSSYTISMVIDMARAGKSSTWNFR
jgi:hypothetical protein